MKRIVLTALTVSLLASTAIAQDRGGRGDRGGQGQASQDGGGFRGNGGGDRGDRGDRGQQQQQPQQQAAPQQPPAQPQPQAQQQQQNGPRPGYGSYLRSPNRNGAPGRPDGNGGGFGGGAGNGRAPQAAPQPQPQPNNNFNNNNDRRGDFRGQGGPGFDNRGQGPQGGQYDRRGEFRDQGRDQGFGRGGPGFENRFDNRGRGGEQFRDRDRGRPEFNPQRYRPSYRAPQRYRVAPYRAPPGFYFRSWSFGDRLPFGWFSPTYYLDWGPYGLPYPPIGCEWVRVGSDALLVDIWTGEVLSVEYGLFW